MPVHDDLVPRDAPGSGYDQFSYLLEVPTGKRISTKKEALVSPMSLHLDHLLPRQASKRNGLRRLLVKLRDTYRLPHLTRRGLMSALLNCANQSSQGEAS